jgi:dipeptidyl aminopeptidase/acylaminoacyl peptidase
LSGGGYERPAFQISGMQLAGSRENLLGANSSEETIEKYSLEKQVTMQTSAAFIVHAADDKAVSPRNSLLFYNALPEKNISASLHICPHS